MWSVKRFTAFSLAAAVMALLLPGTVASATGPGTFPQEPAEGWGGVQQAGEDISALVTEGVTFFVSILIFYLFVGTAASFVEAQWGAITGSPARAGTHLAGKIGQLSLAVILALLVYPLVNWVAGVLLGFI